MKNLVLAIRNLRKTPFVTAVAALSLALGIGANSAIYSLFEQILLRGLPVPEPGRLINLAAPGVKQGSTSCNDAGDCDEIFSFPMFRDLEARQDVLSGLGAHRSFGANIGFGGETVGASGLLVNGGYFSTLRLQAAVGRLIGPEDDAALGESPVAVLAYDTWRNRFGGRPEAIGETLVVNGHTLEIIGVAPRGFFGTTLGSRAQVFVPITLRGAMDPGFDGFEERRSYWVYLFGRLAPGVDRRRAQAALDGIYRGLIQDVEVPLQQHMSEATLALFRDKHLEVTAGARGQSTLHEETRAPLVLLLGVAAVVLLIACANIANLLLARSAARRAEISIRLSIGASRIQLIGQLLVEACVLALLGGAAGLVATHWTLVGLHRLLPAEALATLDLRVSGTVVGFAATLSLATGLLFGLFPAWHSTRIDLATSLKGHAGQPAGSRSANRFRASLVVAQIALSLALLISAGLFIRSLDNIRHVELGLEVENLITFAVAPELNGYDPERSLALFEGIEARLAALPGVSGVTAAIVPALSNDNWTNNVTVEGFDTDPDTDSHSHFNAVGPGYFRTMGIPLLRGRELTDADRPGAARVAVVNQTFARKFGLGDDPVGKRMGLGRTEDLDFEIVGLVRDAKYSSVKAPVPPLYFTPFRQFEQLGWAYFYVRTEQPDAVLAAIPAVVSAMDPNLPVTELETMPQVVRENVYSDRVITVLSSSFGLLATLLAAVGLYGILAYTVSQRTRELGLRMALGADGRRVRMLVFRQVGVLTAIGSAIGLAAALALGRLARAQLFGLEAHDPAVLAASVLTLAAIALLAGLVPATKAARIEPMVALRDD